MYFILLGVTGGSFYIRRNVCLVCTIFLVVMVISHKVSKTYHKGLVVTVHLSVPFWAVFRDNYLQVSVHFVGYFHVYFVVYTILRVTLTNASGKFFSSTVFGLLV